MLGLVGEGSTNNIVEYMGLAESVRHALAQAYTQVAFQVDSMLVAQHVNMKWACRKHELRPFLESIWRNLRAMERRGASVIVEHIYREFNTVADSLANLAVSTRGSAAWLSGDAAQRALQAARVRRH